MHVIVILYKITVVLCLYVGWVPQLFYRKVENAGADIQAKKCTWLIVEALNKANTEQIAILKERIKLFTYVT